MRRDWSRGAFGQLRNLSASSELRVQRNLYQFNIRLIGFLVKVLVCVIYWILSEQGLLENMFEECLCGKKTFKLPYISNL